MAVTTGSDQGNIKILVETECKWINFGINLDWCIYQS